MKKNFTEAGFAAHKLIESLEKRNGNDALDELLGIVENAFEALQRLTANGNENAAHQWVFALIESIDKFYKATSKQKEIFSRIARNWQTWPGFITVENDWKKKNVKTVEDLQLGADVPLNYKGKQWSRENNPEVEAALILVKRLTIRNLTAEKNFQH
jgi:hypothetical protein